MSAVTKSFFVKLNTSAILSPGATAAQAAATSSRTQATAGRSRATAAQAAATSSRTQATASSCKATAGRLAAVVAAVFSALFALLLLSSCGVLADGGTEMGTTNPGHVRDTTPVVLQASQPGIAINDTEKATLDFSNAAQGYVSVLSKLEGIRVKVLVTVDGSKYQYTIDNPGAYITVPLSCGNNTYNIGVWENTEAGTDKYASILSEDIEVVIENEFGPFLYPNQYVNFAAGDASTQISQQSATGATSDVEALNGIYKYVVENITYDHEKAATVQPGYLPNNTDTINTKTGICFDYAVLTAAMLREQQIPAQLVVGYSGTAYHSWIKVYCVDTGKVIGEYQFNGNEWERMDPTFDAASKGLTSLSSLIGDGANYQPMFYY
jgi:hypothetical protein